MTNHITFNSCNASSNERDGIRCIGKDNDQITDITLDDCFNISNDRQGFKTENVDVVRVDLGVFSFNGASGIQIERNTTDVIVDGAKANYNSWKHAGETGIWIDEATGVDILNCEADYNQFAMAVSQSDDICISNCKIRWATDYGPGTAWPFGGLRIGPGAHHYPPNTGLPGQPFGGVRDLEIVGCTFTGNFSPDSNNYRDIVYGDTEFEFGNGPTPKEQMTFTDNELIGTEPDIVFVELDGYEWPDELAGWLTWLQTP